MGSDDKRVVVPPRVKGGDFIRADDHNKLIAAVQTLAESVRRSTVQSSPDVAFRRSDGGTTLWLKGSSPQSRGTCRFQITVDDKIRVGPGVLSFLARDAARLISPTFPKLNGVSLDATERPGFSVDELEADTKYRIVLRYTIDGCGGTRGLDLPAEADTVGKIELLEPGEDGDLEDDERAILIGEVTLQEVGEKLVAKKIRQIQGSDWTHSCAGEEDEDGDSNDVSIGLSDDSLPPGSDDDSDLDPGSDDSDDGSDGSDPDDDADSCGVSFAAKWIERPTCVRPPPLGSATRKFEMTTRVTITLLGDSTKPEIGGGLCDRCQNWWAEVSLEGFKPIELQLPPEAEIVGENKVRFPIDCGGDFYIAWKIDVFVPCATHDFSVRVTSQKKPGPEPDSCCGKVFSKSGPFKMPGWCPGGGCTTIIIPAPPA